MEQEYRFERLNDNNIEDLKILYKDAFDEDRSSEYTRNKFNTKQLGANHIAFIAYDSNNSPAAFYALFPAQVTLDNKSFLAGQVADLMTHSAHRRKGLFLKLANHTHDFAKNNGMKFIFTFQYGTDGPYGGFINLNFTDTNSFNGYYLKLQTFPLNRFAKKIKLLSLFYQPYFRLIKTLFLKKATFFSYPDKNLNYAEISKNEHFIDYKYSYSDCEMIEIGNVKFLFKIKPDGSIAIGDVDKNDPEEIDRAIKKLKRVAFLLGIRIIQFEASKGHLIDQVLSKKYQAVNKFHALYYNLDENFSGDQVRFTYADIDTY